MEQDLDQLMQEDQDLNTDPVSSASQTQEIKNSKTLSQDIRDAQIQLKEQQQKQDQYNQFFEDLIEQNENAELKTQKQVNQQQEQFLKKLSELEEKQVLCKKMGVQATVWDPDKRIYVTNPLLKDFEVELKNHRGKIKNDKEFLQELAEKVRQDWLVKKELEIKEIQAYFMEIVTEENNDDDNLKCDICLDPNSYEENALVICELCLSAVHQSCYGLDLKHSVPEDMWLCQRCKYLKREYCDVIEKKGKLEKISKPFCLFCNDPQGIMIQLVGGPLVDHWVHVLCVNWNSTCSFLLINNEIVYQLDKLPEEKKLEDNHECDHCKDSAGYSIRCDFGNCQLKYHLLEKQENSKDNKVQSKIIQFDTKTLCVSDDGSSTIKMIQDYKSDNTQNNTQTQEKKKPKITLNLSTDDKRQTRSAKKNSSSEQVQKQQKKENSTDKALNNKKQIKQKSEQSSFDEKDDEESDAEDEEEEDEAKHKKQTKKKETSNKKRENKKQNKNEKSSKNSKDSKNKFDKLISDKFQIDKKKKIKKAIQKSNERDIFAKGYSPLANMPKINQQIKPLNNPVTASPPKQISGLRMHLLVEQILQNNMLQKQQQLQNQQQQQQQADSTQNDLSPKKQTSSQGSTHDDSVSNSALTSPQKNYANDSIKLVQVHLELAKLIKLPKVIVRVEQLIVRFKQYLEDKQCLRIYQNQSKGGDNQDQDAAEAKFYIDLTREDELRSMFGVEYIKGYIEDEGDLEIQLWKNLEKIVTILKIPQEN
ncbi:protein jade-3 [Stylonychia lemnae]|uniref:Protein jade-3 n=1 Tax=Stylonychia lemnae TaxID=5949 RepID=A0A078AYA8_STYLE|nr:protein jade-3 [Stylonychia lemnae]|eukprot:CDW86207.1 protein jade-3 [Stylonychia lemnae]